MTYSVEYIDVIQQPRITEVDAPEVTRIVGNGFKYFRIFSTFRVTFVLPLKCNQTLTPNEVFAVPAGKQAWKPSFIVLLQNPCSLCRCWSAVQIRIPEIGNHNLAARLQHMIH